MNQSIPGRFLFVVGSAISCFSVALSAAGQADYVAGDLFTLTDTDAAPNGVWSWFEDERAIVDDSDPQNRLLLVSSVSAGAGEESGDIDLLWRNLDTGEQGHVELNNTLEQDDHNSAALYIRPDGRYIAMYSKHGNDVLNRYRISTRPGDPTAWTAEESHSALAGATYNNLHFLKSDRNGQGRLYNFTRAVNYDPVIQTSLDQGGTWYAHDAQGKPHKLLTQGGGGDRPYLKYASDGEKIHFIATEEHPHDFNNSVYHGYIVDGTLFNSDGVEIDNVFDGQGVSPTALTTVFKAGDTLDGLTLDRAWTIDLALDQQGHPVAIASVRVEGNINDHRFLYARHDGDRWQVYQLGRAGGYLYQSQWDYTGLVAIDPNDTNVVYMSSNINPTTQEKTAKYEIYSGYTSDGGQTWSWYAITSGSTVDNLRPIVPEWSEEETALVWLRGKYTSYLDWSTEVVGIVLSAGPLDPAEPE